MSCWSLQQQKNHSVLVSERVHEKQVVISVQPICSAQTFSYIGSVTCYQTDCEMPAHPTKSEDVCKGSNSFEYRQ